ncbi:hypothetical protein ACGFWI_08540 [Streptomyces sp. NPDC048434]|uniref:hypothetical protein n=1 Tax=Streptomyces sp. NPDC048434 TaxID=3365549 RepID=UPI003718653F
MLLSLDEGHHRTLDSKLTADLDISLVQWDALRHIDRLPGSSVHQPTRLTSQTDQPFGALTGRLTSLHRRGERRPTALRSEGRAGSR